MMILLGMPVIQIVLFGFAITTDVKNTRVAVLDPSNDEITTRITEKIDASEYFNVTEILSSPQEADALFMEGKTNIVIVFEENFGHNLMKQGTAKVQFLVDATDPNMANILSNYLTAQVASFRREMAVGTPMAAPVTPEIRLLYNPQLKGAYNFVPGVLGMILMLVCAMMTSIAIVREKETGTMEVLLVSPMKPLLIILAKVVPYFTVSVVNLCTVLLLAVFVLNVPVAGSLFWLIITSLLFIFVSLSLGIFVSTLTDKQMVAMLISGMLFMIPVMLLSGMIYPVENMPGILRWLSHIIPARWFITATKDLMIKGLGVSAVLKEMAILGFMALFFIAVSYRNFKNRLQ